MNTSKLQIELLRHLTTQTKRVRYCRSGNNFIFTPDGFSAFSIPQKICYLNVEKIPTMISLPGFFELTKKDRVVEFTKELVKSPDGLLCRLQLKDCTREDSSTFVYVRKSFIDTYFEDHTLYAESRLSPVKMVNNITGEVEAIVLPTRFYDGAKDAR